MAGLSDGTAGRSAHLLFALLLLGSWPALAGEKAVIQIEPAGASRQEGKPGQTVTVAVRISNSGAGCSLTLSASAPEGWSPIVPTPVVELGEQVHVIRLVTLRIPWQAAPGEYPLVLTVEDQEDPGERWQMAATVLVLPAYGIDVQVVESPSYLREGEAGEVRVLVKNTGNAPATAELSARGNMAFSLRLDSTRLHLAPQETRAVAVRMKSASVVSSLARYVLSLEVRVKEAPEVKAEASASVDVIPAGHTKETRLPLLPVTLSFSAVHSGTGTATQVAIQGAGMPAEGGEARLEFLLRGPDARSRSRFGERDEYRFSYASDRLAVSLGDRVYRLSPLTEAGRLGMGGEGNLRTGHVRVGGYYARGRMLSHGQQHGAVYLRYGPEEGSGLSVQYLNRMGRLPGEMASVRGELKVRSRLQMDAEWGAGREAGAQSQGYRLKLAGQEPWVSYTMEYTHADPHFPGYHRNVDIRQTDVSLRLLSGLHLKLGGRDARQYPDPAGGHIDRRQQAYRAGMGLSGRLKGATTFLLADYEQQRLRLSHKAAPIERAGRSVSVQMGVNGGAAGLTGMARQGRVAPKEGGPPGSFQEYAVQARVSFPWLKVSAYGAYASGPTLYSAAGQARWSFGTNASVRLFSTSRLDLQLASVLSQRPTPFRTILATARLDHGLPFGHRLRLEGQYRLSGSGVALNEGVVEYAVTYSIPTGVPALRRRQGPRLSGRVYDAETGEGVRGALLRVGHRIQLTGHDGAFTFSNLPEGTHFLMLDPSSIGLSRVPLMELPMEVRVGAESPAELAIGVAGGSRVSGQVNLYSLPEGSVGDRSVGDRQDSLEAVGYKGLLLELSDEVGRVRIVSDEKGRVSLTHLRPGRWSVRILSADLPPHHDLLVEPDVLVLPPSGEGHLKVSIVPRQRSREIIKSGRLEIRGP